MIDFENDKHSKERGTDTQFFYGFTNNGTMINHKKHINKHTIDIPKLKYNSIYKTAFL